MGLDLKVTMFYTGLNITTCLVFAEIGHSTVYHVWGDILPFSEAIGMRNRSPSSQNVTKDNCRFILNITTSYETSLNSI
jgi:hypothetical protein